MPLNKEARIQKIKENEKIKSKKIGRMEIAWDGELTPMDVFKVPIEYLVYNKYNGRILSRTKSLETQNYNIDVETTDGNDLIQDLLFKSHPTRNNKTETNIRTYGQKEVGIITKDGIVIDGNRRLMFLNKIILNPGKNLDVERFKNFKAVILPVTLAEAPDEIRKLETTYQMGEDKKLDYNPIEKYLKAQELENNQISIKKISDWMGETKREIEKYLQTMKTMDDYLEYLEYEGIYTQLDGREDWFLSLSKWVDNFRSEGGSDKPFDGYKTGDVDDLETICYDYIRAKHGGDGKRFRQIAEGQRANHIFGNKELWGKFKQYHFDNVESVKDSETEICFDSNDLKSHLDDRDKQFTKKINTHLEENLNDRISDLSNIRNHGKPEKLIKKAMSALNEVDSKAKSFYNSDTQKQLMEIADKSSKLLYSGDVVQILHQSLNWLNDAKNSIDTDNSDEDERKLELVREINKLSFEMKKILGG